MLTQTKTARFANICLDVTNSILVAPLHCILFFLVPQPYQQHSILHGKLPYMHIRINGMVEETRCSATARWKRCITFSQFWLQPGWPMEMPWWRAIIWCFVCFFFFPPHHFSTKLETQACQHSSQTTVWGTVQVFRAIAAHLKSFLGYSSEVTSKSKQKTTKQTQKNR